MMTISQSLQKILTSDKNHYLLYKDHISVFQKRGLLSDYIDYLYESFKKGQVDELMDEYYQHGFHSKINDEDYKEAKKQGHNMVPDLARERHRLNLIDELNRIEVDVSSRYERLIDRGDKPELPQVFRRFWLV